MLKAMVNAVVTHFHGDPSNSLPLTVALQTLGQNYQKQKVRLTCDSVIKIPLVMFSDAPVHNLNKPSEREGMEKPLYSVTTQAYVIEHGSQY